MQKLIIATIVLLASTVCGFAQPNAHKTAKPADSIDFQQFNGYFEKNNSGLKGDKSYLVLTSQKQFDKIFEAVKMGENTFLPGGVFKSKVVVATIKRGPMRKYDDVKVTAEKGKLFVWYNAKDDEPSSATFASPLIITVNKGKYKEVVFMEKGKKASTVRLKRY